MGGPGATSVGGPGATSVGGPGAAREESWGGGGGRLPACQPRLVVVVHQLLDVGELLVQVLEGGVGLLAVGVRAAPLELGLDL